MTVADAIKELSALRFKNPDIKWTVRKTSRSIVCQLETPSGGEIRYDTNTLAAAKMPDHVLKIKRVFKPLLVPEGQYLLSLREARGLTLRQLAEATGVSNPYISQLERGVIRNPSLGKILALARFFEVPIDEFVEKYQADRDAR